MSDVKWIKIYTNMINNKKIKRIRKMPDGNNIILIWVFLLTTAGESNKNGGLFLTDTLPFKEEDLAIEFDFTVETIRFALITLEKFEMIEVYEDVIYIKNWSEYQNIDGLEKIRAQTRARVAKHRELKQLQQRNAECNVTVTQGNDIEVEVDIELELNSSSTDLSEYEKKILYELKTTTDYKFDYCKDLTHIRNLMIEFPDKNLLEIIKKWKTWLLDKPLKKNSNPRSQIRNWVSGEKQTNTSNGNYSKSSNKSQEPSYRDLPDF